MHMRMNDMGTKYKGHDEGDMRRIDEEHVGRTDAGHMGMKRIWEGKMNEL